MFRLSFFHIIFCLLIAVFFVSESSAKTNNNKAKVKQSVKKEAVGKSLQKNKIVKIKKQQLRKLQQRLSLI